ncbi:MAG TPA: M24 family metallopeptidase, partial [Chloroflexota bacterium]|nr:M24 family metallopeptidase [Chloroflexota bacterium]
TGPPIGRRLAPGTLVSNEVSAIWGGMVAQEVQPILVGSVPEEWRPLVDLQREVFEAGLSFMQPGMSYLELVDFIRGSCRTPGYKAEITLHGRGMGDDGPLITGRSENAKLANLHIEVGNAWVWKPVVRTEDRRHEFQFGGTVALTEQGIERFFRRSPGLMSVA